MTNWSIESLNPVQRKIVEHKSGPALVIAGAGSGKTRVITHRVAELIQTGIPASSILLLTFTNKAAREMKERVQALASRGQTRGLIVSTFHNLGLRILKSELAACGLRRGFSILDQADSKEILKAILLQGESEKDAAAVDGVQKRISDWKNELILPDQAVSHASSDDELRAAMAYSGYNRMLRACNAVDFDDLILMPADMFRAQPRILEKWRHRIQYLLVDEYQDTNGAQYELVRMLALPEGHFTVVGDDDHPGVLPPTRGLQTGDQCPDLGVEIAHGAAVTGHVGHQFVPSLFATAVRRWDRVLHGAYRMPGRAPQRRRMGRPVARHDR